MYDVRPEQYATVIRELIRHENDVTNHRIMWLLVVQGLLVNAYVGVREGSGSSERDNSGGNPREPLSVRDALQELPGSRISPFPGDGSEAGEIARGRSGTRWLAEKENQTLAKKRLDLSLA